MGKHRRSDNTWDQTFNSNTANELKKGYRGCYLQWTTLRGLSTSIPALDSTCTAKQTWLGYSDFFFFTSWAPEFTPIKLKWPVWIVSIF